MNTTLEHLPEHKQKQLREITGIIVKAVDPEKVILFGSHATGRWVERRYTEGGITYESKGGIFPLNTVDNAICLKFMVSFRRSL